LHVEGDGAADVTREVRSALGSRIHPTTSRALDSALNERLGSTTLSSALSTKTGAHDVAAIVKDVVAQRGAELALVIAVTAHGQGMHADVLLVPAEGGEPLLQSEDMPPIEKRSDRVAWWKKVFASPEHPPKRVDEPAAEAPAPPLDEAPYAEAKAKAKVESQPPVETSLAEAPVARERRHEEPGPAEAKPRRLLRYFVHAGFDLTWRRFADTEAVGAARVYEAFPVPSVALSAEAYPVHGLLGLEGSIAQSIGAESTTSDRTSVGTSFLRAGGALRGRVPFRNREPSPFVAVYAGYLYSSFTFDSAPPGREVPTATYQALRFGADARVPIQRLLLTGGAEYDHVVSIGALGTTKAHAPGNGVTGSLGFGFQLSPWLVARVDGHLTWITYRLPRIVPAHAEDMYAGFQLGAELTF
jgi:hypothetical protein